MHVVAWLFGIGSWAAGALTKCVPYSVAERLPTLAEKKTEIMPNKGLMFGEMLASGVEAKKAEALESLLDRQ